MAITQTYINGDSIALTAFLQRLVPEYFASVTYDSENKVITVKDADDNVLLKLDFNSNGSSFGVYAYVDETNYIKNTVYSSFMCEYGYITKKGAMIDLKASSTSFIKGILLITKTNNGKTAFVFNTNMTNSSTETNMRSVYSVTWGDALPVNVISITYNTFSQIVITSFPTNNAYGTTSYTPDAGFMTFSQSFIAKGSYGSIIIDGVTYLTNGYWALKDE